MMHYSLTFARLKKSLIHKINKSLMLRLGEVISLSCSLLDIFYCNSLATFWFLHPKAKELTSTSHYITVKTYVQSSCIGASGINPQFSQLTIKSLLSEPREQDYSFCQYSGHIFVFFLAQHMPISPAQVAPSYSVTVKCFFHIWTDSGTGTETLSGCQPTLEESSRNRPRCGIMWARLGPRRQAYVVTEV